MRSFVFHNILLLSFLLMSCSPGILKGFEKREQAPVSKEALYPLFHSTDSVRLFNMQIDFRKNHFSGILLIKPIADNTYRMAFNTHFGMSVFDFEFSPDRFVVNNCIPILQKKTIINTLENDFRILFFLHLPQEGSAAQVYRHKEQDDLEVNKINGQYYLKDNSRRELLQIEIPHFFSSLHYYFSDYQQQFPASIRIKHDRIRLSMILERIKNEE